MIDLQYPILLVHGFGLRDVKLIGCWGRIPAVLRSEGIDVYLGLHDSNGSIESNGRHLAERITSLSSENGIEKFNVIAHSKGGLDMRYVISTLGMGRYVASLTTLSTPHNGSPLVDKLLQSPDALVRFVAAWSDLTIRMCGDKNPRTYEAFKCFTTPAAVEFNRENPDDPDVFYQSFAFRYKNNFSDNLFFIPHLVVKKIDGENDGLFAPDSVKWGEFRGVYTGSGRRGVSHCDEIDFMRRPLSRREGGEGISDITDFYLDIARDLKKRGF